MIALSRKRSFPLPQKRTCRSSRLRDVAKVVHDLSGNLVTLEVNGNKAKRGRLSTVCALRCMSVFGVFRESEDRLDVSFSIIKGYESKRSLQKDR